MHDTLRMCLGLFKHSAKKGSFMPALTYLLVMFITIYTPLHASDIGKERHIPIASSDGWVEVSEEQNEKRRNIYSIKRSSAYRELLHDTIRHIA